MKTKQEYKTNSEGCLSLLPEIQDQEVNLIITDLPFGTTKNPWDVVIPADKLWEEYSRIIKPNGAILLFGQDKFTARMMLSNPSWHRYNLIWSKVLKTGFLNANLMPLREHEDIMVFYNEPPTYNPQKVKGDKNHSKKIKPSTNNNYGEFDVTDNSDALGNMKFPGSILTFEKPHPSICVHPTQKPLKLIEYLIKTYSNEGDMVHDSCIGSGTILEACMTTNRNCKGFEISNAWEEHYRKRLRLDTIKLDAFNTSA